jgi:hypothetical protein
MRTITLILRLRSDEENLQGALEDPVTGLRAVFSSLDDLGVRLRAMQSEERNRGGEEMDDSQDQDDAPTVP